MFDADRLLKALMKGDMLFSDIFFEERNYNHLHFESSRFEKIEKGCDRGVGMRAVKPWKTFFASTNVVEEDNLLDIAKRLGKFSDSREEHEIKKGDHIKGSYPFSIKRNPAEVELNKKLAMLRNIDAIARAEEKRIRQVRIIYRDTAQEVNIYNSDGGNVTDKRCQVILNIFVVGEKSGDIQTAYDSIGGFYGFEFFTEERIEDFVKSTAKRLSGLLDAIEAPMGIKTVVLASEAGGTMIHEAVGHGLEADLAMEGLSCYKGMTGEKIASHLINVADDATVPNMRGTYAYDDDGVASQRTLLIENGILKNYIFDKFHALKYGKESTGNGRRESFRFKPIPRMSNTMILPGKEDPSKIVSSVDDGIYVIKMGGGQVDTVRGDFVFEIQEGYVIEKGMKGKMIKNATMMGNGLEVLRSIDMVGSDLGFGIGTCGKDGQGVPVSDAQPTLRIPEIVVGGKER